MSLTGASTTPWPRSARTPTRRPAPPRRSRRRSSPPRRRFPRSSGTRWPGRRSTGRGCSRCSSWAAWRCRPDLFHRPWAAHRRTPRHRKAAMPLSPPPPPQGGYAPAPPQGPGPRPALPYGQPGYGPPPGPGYPAGGYGPGYPPGGGYGPPPPRQGGGFVSGALGGLGGAVLGNILYDKFGHPHTPEGQPFPMPPQGADHAQRGPARLHRRTGRTARPPNRTTPTRAPVPTGETSPIPADSPPPIGNQTTPAHRRVDEDTHREPRQRQLG